MSLQPERINGVRFAVPPAIVSMHLPPTPAAGALKQDDRRAIGAEALLHIGAGAADPDDFIADDGNRVPKEGRKWMRTRTNLERVEARGTLSFE